MTVSIVACISPWIHVSELHQIFPAYCVVALHENPETELAELIVLTQDPVHDNRLWLLLGLFWRRYTSGFPVCCFPIMDPVAV